MQLIQKLREKKGSSLVVVIVAFAVLVITGIMLITIAANGHKTAIHYHRKQQAQYTARTVMDTIKSALADPSVSGKLIDAVTRNQVVGEGDLSTQNLGTYKVTMNPPAAPVGGGKALVKVTVLATYQGVSYNLSAYYIEGKGDRMNPLDFVLFNHMGPIGKNNPPGVTGNTVYDGKILERGSFNYEKITFTQKTLITGAATIKDCIFESDLIYQSTMHDLGGNEFRGGKYTQGGVGNDGNTITDIGYNDNIQKYQRKWRSIDYYNVSPSADFYVNGVKFAYPYYTADTANLPAGATLTGNIITFADGDIMDITTKVCETVDGDKLDFNGKYTTAAADFGYVQKKPTTSGVPLGGTFVAGRHRIAGTSTTGDSAIDTSGGDVHLFIGSSFTARNKITITGENNVYIHMASGTTFSIASGVIIGENGKSEHQLFIEGESVNFDIAGGGAQLRGAAYLVNGKYTDASDPGVNKVYGSITASDITTTAGNTYKYADYIKEPECNATIVATEGSPPPKIFIFPQNTSSQSNWELFKYDK